MRLKKQISHHATAGAYFGYHNGGGQGMSTGIGRHKFVGGDEYARSAYSTPKAICPYCGYDGCEADYVDAGVGSNKVGLQLIQCLSRHSLL